MKGHVVMYLILAAFGVAVLSRPASAAGLMVAGGGETQGILGVLSGQYAGGGGAHGSINVPTPSGMAGASF